MLKNSWKLLHIFLVEYLWERWFYSPLLSIDIAVVYSLTHKQHKLSHCLFMHYQNKLLLWFACQHAYKIHKMYTAQKILEYLPFNKIIAKQDSLKISLDKVATDSMHHEHQSSNKIYCLNFAFPMANASAGGSQFHNVLPRFLSSCQDVLSLFWKILKRKWTWWLYLSSYQKASTLHMLPSVIWIKYTWQWKVASLMNLFLTLNFWILKSIFIYYLYLF